MQDRRFSRTPPANLCNRPTPRAPGARTPAPDPTLGTRARVLASTLAKIMFCDFDVIVGVGTDAVTAPAECTGSFIRLDDLERLCQE